MSQVNLDALIKREDMFVPATVGKTPSLPAQDFKITDLESTAFFFASLRKPDFQRETTDWTPDKICDFIESFLNGDLIPAIVMWNNGTSNFAIDGAHRISALIAWVRDDYGQGNLSKPFFGSDIDEGILKLAQKTRLLVNKKIGTYQEHKDIIQNPNSDPKLYERAIRLGNTSIKLQWVSGDYQVAERSFFKINESATPISDTEKKLLKSRRKPNSIAARAIIHSGAGHKYWSKFSPETQAQIEQLAIEVNELLFTPEYDTPTMTTELPIGGKGYSNQTLELILNLINLANDVVVEDKKGKIEPDDIPDDIEGQATIDYLKRTKQALSRITTKESHSLGLHPAVYFYSNTGRHQFTSLMAWMEMIKDMDLHKSFRKFKDVRRTFEDFFLKYKIFVNQTITKQGSGAKGYKKLFRLFKLIVESFEAGKTEPEVLNILKSDKEFFFLNPDDKENSPISKKDFSSESKSVVFFRQAFPNPLVCALCNGYVHPRSMQVDHIIKRENGGIGHPDNGQITHPYCNSLK